MARARQESIWAVMCHQTTWIHGMLFGKDTLDPAALNPWRVRKKIDRKASTENAWRMMDAFFGGAGRRR